MLYNKFVIKKVYLILAIILIISNSTTFGLKNQTITILPKEENDNKICLWLEAELSESDKVNVYHSFENPTIGNEAMFMVNKKLSGLLIVEKSNINVFTTKGLLTNLTITETNIKDIVKTITQIFPPKEPEKIIKEITEIDYISPLEEKTPKHSLSLQMGYLGEEISFLKYETNDFEQYYRDIGKISPKIPAVYIGYHFDSRYFSYSLIFNLTQDLSSFGVELIPGLWLFKGFMFLGLDVFLENTTRITINSNLNLYLSPNTKITLLTLSITPFIKFKLSKDDHIGISPLLLFRLGISHRIDSEQNLILQETELQDQERNTPKFIGLCTYFELKMIENVSLVLSTKILTPPVNRSMKIITSNTELILLQEIFFTGKIGIKYKF